MSVKHQPNIHAFQQGNAAAFEQVYALFYRRLNYFAFTITGNATIAHDIAQESFIQLWNKRTDFSSVDKIKSFLFIAARHGCIDYLRAEKRHQQSHAEIRYLSDETASLFNHEMILSGVMMEIFQQVKNLPPQCSEVFRLIYMEGKSTAETAVILHTSTKNVLKQKAKAVRLFKASLLQKDLLPLLVLIPGLLWDENIFPFSG